MDRPTLKETGPTNLGPRPLTPGSQFALDPFGTPKQAADKTSPHPEVVKKFHDRSDVDSSSVAQHHTLGMKHDQASPGDHKHDGKNSRKLMEGITITGSKGGNAALASLITALSGSLGFTDNTT